MMFAAEVIISGFVSKVVNNCVDVSWDKIKKAVKDKNNKHQSLESQIYNVIVDVFNLITYNQYKNDQDKIYEATELLLIGFKSNKRDDIEVIRSSLELFYANVDNDKCMEFMKLLYQELSKDVYEALYKEIRLLQEEQESRKTTRIEQKVDKIECGIEVLKSNSQMQSVLQNSVPKPKVKSRTQEYVDKWNANMFLNDFEEWDENAGVNVKLSDVYIEDHLPHFIWGQNEKGSNNLDRLLNKYIKGENNESKMLLILGQPGIGKSTLITWITAKFNENVEDILVYQFASDLKNVNWQSSDLYNEILTALNLSKRDLNGKVLILDGFDEVSVGDNRKEILDNLYWEFTYRLLIKRLILIITCRENYIQDIRKAKCQYITLLPWDEAQIKSFSTLFQEKINDILPAHTIAKVIENKEILGIPLILYMVLALNIAVEKDGSIVDIYDKIFSLDGGIYDRCIDNKNFADIHRISEIKKQIHQVSREIAIWMFENNPDEAYIPQKEYEKICDRVIKESEQKNVDIKQDFKIGNYFRLVKHCEGVGNEELYFVHRSIYEYFVAETIYSCIEKPMIELSEKSQKELGRKISFYLKQGKITHTIEEYLQYKIFISYSKLSSEKQNRFYQLLEMMIDHLMKNGMFYYTEKNIKKYRDILVKEFRCFGNLIKILKILININQQKYIMENVDKCQLVKYIRFCLAICRENSIDHFNLSKMFLKKANMAEIDLRHTILTEANLQEADLSKSLLSSVDLSKTDLTKAYLVEVDLREACLHEAKLCHADLTGADLRGANLQKANLEGSCVNKSIWREDDVHLFSSQLKKARFSHIIIENESKSELRTVHRGRIFFE